MNKQWSAIGIGLATLVLSACSNSAGDEYKDDNSIERLGSCSIVDSPFEGAQFQSWKGTYHTTVSNVIQADIDSLANPQCIDRDDNLPPPTDVLKNLASTLPPWKNAPTRLERISEADLSAVLLEYMRTYQCAMLEYRAFYFSTGTGNTLTRSQFLEQQEIDDKRITDELSVSREALTRTLALTGRMNRLRPLFFDIDCFLAASLDLRNQLGIAAEISSCLPRVQDAAGSLRDFSLPDPT